MLSKKHYYFIGSLIVIGVLLLGWLRYNQWANSKESQPINSNNITVRLKWKHNPQFAGMYVALDKGFYKDKGLDVTLLPYDKNSGSVIDEVASNKVNFGITGPYNTILGVSSGKPIKAIAAVYQTSPGAILSVRDVQLNSPADLRNKTIGLSRSEPGNLAFFQLFLQKYKIPVNSVSFITTGTNNIESLLEGQAQASAVYRYEALLVKKQGVPYSLLLPEEYGFNSYNDIIVANTTTINNQPDKVRSFIEATQQGWAYAIDHPDEAAAISLSYDQAAGVDLAYNQAALKEISSLVKPSQSQPIGVMSADRWQTMSDTLKQIVLLKKFSMDNLFTTEFVYPRDNN